MIEAVITIMDITTSLSARTRFISYQFLKQLFMSRCTYTNLVQKNREMSSEAIKT